MANIASLPPDLFRWMMERYVCTRLHTTVVCLFVSKRFNTVARETKMGKEWYNKHCFLDDPGMCAVRAGEVQVLQWLCSKKLCTSDGPKLMREAVASGTMTHWYMNEKKAVMAPKEVLEIAAEHDQVGILENYWARGILVHSAGQRSWSEVAKSSVRVQELLWEVGERGAVSVFRWMLEKFPTIEEWITSDEDLVETLYTHPRLIRYIVMESSLSFRNWKADGKYILASGDVALSRDYIREIMTDPNDPAAVHAFLNGDFSPVETLLRHDNRELLDLWLPFLDVTLEEIMKNREAIEVARAYRIARSFGWNPSDISANVLRAMLQKAVERRDVEGLRWLGSSRQVQHIHMYPVIVDAVTAGWMEGLQWCVEAWSEDAGCIIVSAAYHHPRRVTREVAQMVKQHETEKCSMNWSGCRACVRWMK